MVMYYREYVVEHIQSKLQYELELRSAPVAAATKVIQGMELYVFWASKISHPFFKRPYS